jgi:NTE family protein
VSEDGCMDQIPISLVLGGGSIKGAFQAGAIEVVFASNFVPEAIYGISAGTLNAAYLVHHSGQMIIESGKVNWPKLGAELSTFWLKYVTCPDRLIKVREDKAILFTHPDQGLYDNSPLRKRLQTFLGDGESFLKCPIPFHLGAVDLYDGTLNYFSIQDFEHYPSKQIADKIHDCILASSAIPLGMPLAFIKNKLYCDGGVIAVVPVEKALEDNPNRMIVCIACQPKITPYGIFDKSDFVELLERITGIMSDAETESDLEKLKTSDILIRPKQLIKYEINDFTKTDIEEMVNLGRDAAKVILQPIVA